MNINPILVFGQLTDLMQTDRLELHDLHDTTELLQRIHQQFPAMETASFVVAVNNTIIQDNTTIQPGDTIALMPPFSGG